MPERTYKKIELVGSSAESIEDAIKNACSKASTSVHNLRWFEVTEIRGNLEGGNPTFQVTIKVGFRLDDGA